MNTSKPWQSALWSNDADHLWLGRLHCANEGFLYNTGWSFREGYLFVVFVHEARVLSMTGYLRHWVRQRFCARRKDLQPLSLCTEGSKEVPVPGASNRHTAQKPKVLELLLKVLWELSERWKDAIMYPLKNFTKILNVRYFKVPKNQNYCQKFLIILYTHKLFSTNLSYLDCRVFLCHVFWIEKKSRGWTDSSEVKTTLLFPEDLSSQHPCGGWWLSVIPVLGDLAPSSAIHTDQTRTQFTYIPMKHS